MGEKSIDIKFTKEQIEKYNGQGSKLCFSAGVGNDVQYNVIAWAEDIGPNVSISWEDKYKIAGTKTNFTNGAKIKINTDPAEIKFDQLYTLPESWTNGDITDEKQNPEKSSFRMLNKTKNPASAVVYKVIDGKDQPFYVSQFPIDPQGSEGMTPKSKVALWFQVNAETRTMFSVNKTSVSEFDFTSRSGIKLKWDGSKFVEDK